MEFFKERYMAAKGYALTALKWLFCAAIIGTICGVVGTLFHFLIQKATFLRNDNPWLLYCLPIAGVIIVFLYKTFGMEEDRGTNLIIESIRTSKVIPIVMAPLIFVATALTHFCGGSSGREGAALQIGGSIGSSLGRIFKMKDSDIHIITMCGMSAVFSALFGTPLTAAIFSMEVVSVGVIYYSALLPCMLSALIAAGVSNYFGIVSESYYVVLLPDFSVEVLVKVAIVAALCAIVSIAFVVAMHTSGKIYKKIPNQYIRIMVGAIIVIALTVIVGNTDYNGAGMDIISQAFVKDSVPTAFIMKIIFTALTLGAGFKGGEIVPAFFIGATFGNVIGGLVGLNTGFGAAVGLVSVFCGVVNCPFTAILLSIELFGSNDVLLFGFAIAISYMLSGYYSLYSSQKIVYSKLKAEYIDFKHK